MFESPLRARIRALLRRSNSNCFPVLTWGDLQLDPCSCQVTYQGNLLLLTAKEYQLLELFMRHSQEVFNAEEIIENLWSSVEYPSPATVRSHLRRLRKKLKLAGLPENPIETLKGRGYCLKSLSQHNNSGELLSLFPAETKDDKPPEKNLWREQVTVNCPLVLVIDNDIQFTELLTQKATAEGIRTAIAPSPELARTWLEGLQNHQRPNLVLLRLSFIESASNPISLGGSLSLIAEFKSMVPSIPVIIIADRDQFQDRLLVTQHGGTFYLKQPVTPAQAIAFCQQVLKPSSQGKKVMIVDEDVEFLRVLPSLLQPWGFKLTTLDDSRQFWDVLEAVTPDVLLMNMEMPYLSGIELCKVLRSHPHWYRLPVLYLGNYTRTNISSQLLASGADDFVPKPVVAKQLAHRILHHLERLKE